MPRDIAIGRKGDQLTGECLTPRFTMETSFGTLHFDKTNIRRIEFKGRNGLKHDEITTKRNDRSIGRLLTDPVEFQTEDGTIHRLPKAALLALLLNWGFDDNAEPLI